MKKFVFVFMMTASISSTVFAQQKEPTLAEQSLSAALTQVQASVVMFAREKMDELKALKDHEAKRETEWHKWLSEFCGDPSLKHCYAVTFKSNEKK